MVSIPYLIGSSMLLGVPREIRDCIYDYALYCDSEDPVVLHASGYKGDRIRLLLPIGPLDLKLTDKALALLYVNHQISNEAAGRFYGKRTFSGNSKALLMFLFEIGQCRKFLKKVMVCEISGNHEVYLTHSRDLISDLSTLPALTSFQYRMTEDEYNYHSVYEFLIKNGVHRLGCELEVCNNWFSNRLALSPDDPMKTFVRLSQRWTCAKDSLEWEGGELHCQTLAWLSPGTRTWVSAPEPRLELCDHIHEIPRWAAWNVQVK